MRDYAKQRPYSRKIRSVSCAPSFPDHSNNFATSSLGALGYVSAEFCFDLFFFFLSFFYEGGRDDEKKRNEGGLFFFLRPGRVTGFLMS